MSVSRPTYDWHRQPCFQTLLQVSKADYLSQLLLNKHNKKGLGFIQWRKENSEVTLLNVNAEN
jgi:hypothetical protein